MCLLVLAWQSHPRYRLIVAANRDEFHDRPAAPLAPWDDAPQLIAGRDLRAGGAWLGVDRERRFGVVTNYRELQRPRRSAPSRGRLIPEFLSGARNAREYLAELETDAPGYSGFNLLLAAGDGLWYASNRADSFARQLSPGIHGLANQDLDAPSPKLLRVRRRFEASIARGDEISAAELFVILADRERLGPDEELPSTGLSPEWERALSSPFVVHGQYGTRCSTVVLLEHSGALRIAEHRFDATGQASGQSEYTLNAAEWPRAAA
ncbi:MAG: NRDE family protein [Gammaproteobacteria bacterium]